MACSTFGMHVHAQPDQQPTADILVAGQTNGGTDRFFESAH